MSPPAAPSVPTLDLELSLVERGCLRIAGVDEVGRGSLAGPLVAAAVILPLRDPHLLATLAGVRDSKALSPEARSRAFDAIMSASEALAVGWASHHVIDRHGLAEANRRALCRAVLALPAPPDGLLVDHFRLPSLDLPQVCIPKGDARSLTIAAASIVAKVVRDRWMRTWDRRYPHFGFAVHKGYGTRSHLAALEAWGPCPLHRLSFAPVAAAVR